jgi:hypothetical protein
MTGNRNNSKLLLSKKQQLEYGNIYLCIKKKKKQTGASVSERWIKMVAHNF